MNFHFLKEFFSLVETFSWIEKNSLILSEKEKNIVNGVKKESRRNGLIGSLIAAFPSVVWIYKNELFPLSKKPFIYFFGSTLLGNLFGSFCLSRNYLRILLQTNSNLGDMTWIILKDHDPSNPLIQEYPRDNMLYNEMLSTQTADDPTNIQVIRLPMIVPIDPVTGNPVALSSDNFQKLQNKFENNIIKDFENLRNKRRKHDEYEEENEDEEEEDEEEDEEENEEDEEDEEEEEEENPEKNPFLGKKNFNRL